MQIDTTIQQIKDLLFSESVRKVLITSGKNVDPDAASSVLAMALSLQQARPDLAITTAIEDFLPDRYQFLPGIEKLGSVVAQKSLVVSIDVSSNPIEKINYNAEDTTFNFILTPKAGPVDVDQIKYSYAGLTYDAIIIVDTANKSLLGKWAEDFAQELQDIPVINIDHHPDNDHFGSLNLVDSNAASATAVLAELFPSLGLPISADVATNLVTGIFSDTSSFANSNANSSALRIVADLVDKGADLQRVTRGLFRSYDLATLKLWGKVLQNITIEAPGIAAVKVSQTEITDTQASDADVQTLGGLVNSFLTSLPNTQVGVMVKDKGNGEVTASLRGIGPDVDVSAIAHQFGGGGHVKAAGIRLTNTNLDQAYDDILAAIRAYLTQLPSTQAAAEPNIATANDSMSSTEA